MPVQPIKSLQEFRTLINKDQPILIDFWATWCGPCRIISPVFEGLSTRSDGLGFYKVDVDDQQQISQEAGIRAMPTFTLFHRGTKVDELVGANPQALQALVDKAKSLT